MKFTDEFNEEKNMIKYCVRTHRELGKFETEEEFTEAMRKELKTYETINNFENFIYTERNRVFELVNRFNKKELTLWSLPQIEDEIDFCEKQNEKVKWANKSYNKLTGEDCFIYRQYNYLMTEVFGSLVTETMIRKMDGDFN